MRRCARLLPVLLLTATLAPSACRHQPPPTPPPGPTVRVVNRSGCRAAVWVARDSVHTRLGAVADGKEAEWTIPRSYIQGRDSVRFLSFRGDSQCVQVRRLPLAGATRLTLLLQNLPDSTLLAGAGCPCRFEDAPLQPIPAPSTDEPPPAE